MRRVSDFARRLRLRLWRFAWIRRRWPLRLPGAEHGSYNRVSDPFMPEMMIWLAKQTMEDEHTQAQEMHKAFADAGLALRRLAALMRVLLLDLLARECLPQEEMGDEAVEKKNGRRGGSVGG